MLPLAAAARGTTETTRRRHRVRVSTKVPIDKSRPSVKTCRARSLLSRGSACRAEIPQRHAPDRRAANHRLCANFDPQPFHTDPEAAKHSLFGSLVASGWHTAAISMRLMVESGLPIAGGLIGAGGSIDWPRPTRPGDILQVEIEVVEVRPSRSRPDRGLVTIRSQTRNQRGEIVQILTAKLVVPNRT